MSSPIGMSSHTPHPQDVTNVWTAFGHSFIQHASGTWDQSGRIDALFRSALRIENSNWANYAISGARMTSGSMWNGGWLNFFYNTQRRPTKVWPYVPYGGGALIVTGINDVGNLGNTTQSRTAWEHVNRACISRWRASTVRLNTDASIAYGAGFTSVTGQEERSTTGTLRQATTTTAATVTITIPSTYKGEPISICFIGRSGVVGGTVTFSGAGGAVSGTLSTSNILPSAANEYCPVIKRITNLTSANAGQTIVCTVSQMDASGNVLFDGYWIESLTPQPVILANISKLTPVAHAAYYTSTWTGSEAVRGADVDAWNLVLTNLVRNEFDSMVQVADFDRALNKDPDLMNPNDSQLHPNEHGAAKCVDALMDAVDRLKPVPSRVGKFGTAAHFNPTAPAGSGNRLPQGRVGYWYSSQYKQISATTTTAIVSGTIHAIPFVITEPDTRWDQVAVETTNTPNAANAVRLGVYGDLRWSGYPQHLITEWATPLTFTASTGFKTANIAWEPDPGLYWIFIKPVNATATAATLRYIDGPCPQMPSLMGTGPTASAVSPMAWTLTGQGTSSMPTRFPSTATPIDRAPLIALRRSAAA
jgi:hypothetical protein